MRQKLLLPIDDIIQRSKEIFAGRYGSLNHSQQIDIELIYGSAIDFSRIVDEAFTLLEEENYPGLYQLAGELYEPAGDINAYGNLLLYEIDGALTDEQKEQVTMIVTDSRFVSEQLDNLIEYVRIISKRLGFFPKPFDLNPILALKPTTPLSSGVAFHVDSPTVPLVYGEEYRIQQVFQQLINNAAQFTQTGEIRVTADVQPDRVEVRIADTGPGILNADQEKLFTPFWQVDAKSPGLGLGLFIARKFLEHQGRSLTLTPNNGAGILLAFALPRVPNRGE